MLKSFFISAIRLANTRQMPHCSLLITSARLKSEFGRLPKGYNAVNGYALFMKRNNTDGTKAIEKSPEIAKMWKELPEEEKKVHFYLLPWLRQMDNFSSMGRDVSGYQVKKGSNF